MGNERTLQFALAFDPDACTICALAVSGHPPAGMHLGATALFNWHLPRVGHGYRGCPTLNERFSNRFVMFAAIRLVKGREECEGQLHR
jgi:hypothetical protein